MHPHGQNRSCHGKFFVGIKEEIGYRACRIPSIREQAGKEDVLSPVVNGIGLIIFQSGHKSVIVTDAALFRRAFQFSLIIQKVLF